MLTRRTLLLVAALALFVSLQSAPPIAAQDRKDNRDPMYPEWRTNTAKQTINLDDLDSPGVTKDGIPAIDRPQFATNKEARAWLGEREPVVALEVNGVGRAYPMQILVWHEVANDVVGGVPVAITFCSVCHSAIVYDRRVEGRTLSFGVSGFIYGANMVLYDRETESWWQQFTGRALVGDLTGSRLKRLPAQLISFAEFAAAYPRGQVMSQQTGYKREYGRNPHLKYDNLNGYPSHFRGKLDRRLKPMEKVVGVEVGDKARAYPYAVSGARHVIADRIGAQDIVVFHTEGTLSALDEEYIRDSKAAGSTGVFDPTLEGKRLEFRYDNGEFIDAATGSRWNILGRAVSGPLRGKSLKPLPHGDYFAFAWIAYKPQTEIYPQ
ncbi:MAG TPA: DUF3179 domain-containing protein [Blastocatellia bacterium]|nr:DUF3179 domain-containing protein [Blastocatellia bacterium]